MNNISFKDVHIKGYYFNGLKNVDINIQDIPNYDISDTNLEGVKVIGSLEGANIKGTNFKGYIGDLVLNPQLVKDKDLGRTNLDGIIVNGLFDGCNISMIKFKGAKGRLIVNPQLVKNKDLTGINFDGVELVGYSNQDTNDMCFKDPSFDDCVISSTSFTGCKGKILIIGKNVKNKRMQLSDLTNAIIIGDLNGVDFSYSKLNDNTLRMIHYYERLKAQQDLKELEKTCIEYKNVKKKKLFLRKK